MTMQHLRRNPIFRKPAAGLATLLLSIFLCLGCANPGPPRPPSLHLPALVTDLTAERIGDHVLLSWTTPSQTTDKLPVKGAMTAEICREVGPRPGTPVARLAACAPILSLAVVPGPSHVSDVLQPALRSDPVVLLTYRVQILNSAERSAGSSGSAALGAAGAAPSPVEDLKALPGEHGAILEWDVAAGKKFGVVELQRRDLSAPQTGHTKKAVQSPVSRPGGKNKPARAKAADEHPDEVRLRAPEILNATNQAAAGTVDATAKTGDTYSYTAQRVRAVTTGGHALEIRSEPSSPVTLAMRDIFPPARPTGLETISGTVATAAQQGSPSAAASSYIDLSWEPNSEPDLAGYLVYRQSANADGSPRGALIKLTPSLITAPAYRDVAVNPGQRYIYQVTAVDASGNESAPSAKAQEVVTTGLNSPN